MAVQLKQEADHGSCLCLSLVLLSGSQGPVPPKVEERLSLYRTLRQVKRQSRPAGCYRLIILGLDTENQERRKAGV